MILQVLFWLFFAVLFYTYAGYALLLTLLVRLKAWCCPAPRISRKENFEPPVCLFVTAYNEKDFAEQKVSNSFKLDYPSEKVQYIWVTDGSDDGTPDLLRRYPQVEVYHQPGRRGKIDAMNRGMQFVRAPLVIFSDANTRLSPNTIRDMVDCFRDPKVGCVAGEKRIVQKHAETAAAAGEGFYWRMESWIKKMDAQLNSAMGGVGELFAIRTELFEPVEKDTILDDFIITLRIAAKGYRIEYTPYAYAEETASLNVKEELKRKIRIAAGGVQAMTRLWPLLNPFRYGVLSWQYFSHKVLRWTLAPLSLPLFLLVNLLLVWSSGNWNPSAFYAAALYFQGFCYLMALAGWLFENKKLRWKILFVPFYFVSINYASLRGIFRFLKGKQTVNWEKSKRA